MVFTAWWEEAVNSIDFSDSSRETWSTTNKPTGRSGFWTLFPSVLRFSKLRTFTACEERGTRKKEPWSYKARQQWSVRPTESPMMEVVSLVLSRQRRLLTPSTTWSWEYPGISFYFLGVCTQRWNSCQNLVMRFLPFLHAPYQNSKDMLKNTNSCDP